MRATRFVSIATCTAAAALLAACASRPVVVNSYPQVSAAPPAVVTVPAVTTVTPVAPIAPPVAVAPVLAPAIEYGRITNIEFMQSTVMGAPAAGGPARTTTTTAGYRITLHTDAGGWRTYDVPSTGDLRIGDRVRVENGVIYHA